MSEIIKSLSIENLVNQRMALEDIFSQVHELLLKADKIAMQANLEGVANLFDSRRHGKEDFSMLESAAVSKAMKVIDSKAWKYLMQESGMLDLMDATTKSNWHDSLMEGKFPQLTTENIKSTFENLNSAKIDMFEQGIIANFKSLSWDYKTNSPVKFGAKVIMNSFLKRGSPNFLTVDKVADLLRIFYILEKRPEPDYNSSIRETIWQAYRSGATVAENEYVQIKWFKKGSAHLIFKKPELVKNLNLVIAKHFPHALAHAA